MADRLTNIELLLMFAENARATGDDLSAEMHQRVTEHVKRVAELSVMIDKAKTLLQGETERWAAYFPRESKNLVGDEPARLPQRSPLPQHLKREAVNADR